MPLLPKNWLPPRQVLVMGILNVTPDSFADRGAYHDRKAAIERGLEMEREGSGIIDVGGESTRPGATPVSAEEELDRVIPVIEGLRRKGLRILLSIDTYKSEVAERAIRAGAQVINDISGLRIDPGMAAMARKHRAGLILMHIRGTPQTMQQLPPVSNIVRSARQGLLWSIGRALAAGVEPRQVVLDPGIGFGKTLDQNFELIAALPRLRRLGYPLLVGPSRKSFIRKTIAAHLEEHLVPHLVHKAAQVSAQHESQRRSSRGMKKSGEASDEQILHGTAAVVAACILNGAQMVRVHDVRQMVAVAALAARMREESAR